MIILIYNFYGEHLMMKIKWKKVNIRMILIENMNKLDLDLNLWFWDASVLKMSFIYNFSNW